MSECIKLCCLKCRVQNYPEDLREEGLDDGVAISRSRCPECNGAEFAKVPPQKQ